MNRVLCKMIFVLTLITMSLSVYAVPTAKITYKVLSEAGEPIEGAEIMVGFRPYYGGNPNPTVEEGLTDEGGLFTASGSTQYNVSASIRKEGFYNSGNTFGGNQFTSISGFTGFRRWEPWNPTITVVLKKIKEPIALYMRDLGSVAAYNGVKDDPNSFLTEVNRFIGFDLIESDWVIPYGSGTTADVEFKLEKDVRSIVDFDYKLTMRFPNEGDGIQSYFVPKDNASIFRVPYHAPLENYQNELVRNLSSRYRVTDKDRPDQNYFFRIRTKKDEKGNVVSALYGKIEGNIKIQAASKDNLGRIKFKYYLNPTPNDTNLEYDSEKNLFGTKFSKKR